MTTDHSPIPAAPAVGDTRTVVYKYQHEECENCGELATKRITFLDDGDRGARRNPDSKAYGKDDCSWCCDEEHFSCEGCQKEVEGFATRGFGLCSIFPLANFPHMAAKWVKKSETIEPAAGAGL